MLRLLCMQISMDCVVVGLSQRHAVAQPNKSFIHIDDVNVWIWNFENRSLWNKEPKEEEKNMRAIENNGQIEPWTNLEGQTIASFYR